jgi:hypothetical protein
MFDSKKMDLLSGTGLWRDFIAAQDDKKPEFLSELVCTCDGETLSLLLGGDFNIICRKRRKIIIILIRDGLSCLMQSS